MAIRLLGIGQVLYLVSISTRFWPEEIQDMQDMHSSYSSAMESRESPKFHRSGWQVTSRKGTPVEETKVHLGPRERQIAELLLQGCDNEEIARQLNMARRTVKAHFNRLFLRFGITQGIKRVQLATLLYRRQLCLQSNAMETGSPVNANTASSNLLPRDSRIATSPAKLAPPNTSSRITSVIYDKLGLWNRVELALWYEARRAEFAQA